MSDLLTRAASTTLDLADELLTSRDAHLVLVDPLSSNMKRPHSCEDHGACLTARAVGPTRNRDVLEAVLAEHPGLHLGVAPSDRLVVVDLDSVDALYELTEATGLPLSGHYVVKTPRGWHVYLRVDGYTPLRSRAGVDLRHDGAETTRQYVVAPGQTRVDGGEYRVLYGTWGSWNRDDDVVRYFQEGYSEETIERYVREREDRRSAARRGVPRRRSRASIAGGPVPRGGTGAPSRPRRGGESRTPGTPVKESNKRGWVGRRGGASPRDRALVARLSDLSEAYSRPGPLRDARTDRSRSGDLAVVWHVARSHGRSPAEAVELVVRSAPPLSSRALDASHSWLLADAERVYAKSGSGRREYVDGGLRDAVAGAFGEGSLPVRAVEALLGLVRRLQRLEVGLGVEELGGLLDVTKMTASRTLRSLIDGGFLVVAREHVWRSNAPGRVREFLLPLVAEAPRPPRRGLSSLARAARAALLLLPRPRTPLDDVERRLDTPADPDPRGPSPTTGATLS